MLINAHPLDEYSCSDICLNRRTTHSSCPPVGLQPSMNINEDTRRPRRLIMLGHYCRVVGILQPLGSVRWNPGGLNKSSS